MASNPQPSTRRVELGILLRSYRERAGLEPKQVSDALGWYAAKVGRVEIGTRKLVPTEVDRLIELYGLDDQEAATVRALAGEARKRGPVGPVPDWAQSYVALESAATEVKAFSEELIPGLAQTEGYARALLGMSLTVTDDADVDRQVAARMERQRRLTGPDAPRVWLVLSEAALRRPVGGRAVFRDQLAHFRELASLPNVTFQVMAADAGEHVAIGVSFRVLHFAVTSATYVYLEGLTDGTYLDRPPHTDVYTLVFDRVRVAALPDRDSLAVLDRYLSDLA